MTFVGELVLAVWPVVWGRRIPPSPDGADARQSQQPAMSTSTRSLIAAGALAVAAAVGFLVIAAFQIRSPRPRRAARCRAPGRHAPRSAARGRDGSPYSMLGIGGVSYVVALVVLRFRR